MLTLMLPTPNYQVLTETSHGNGNNKVNCHNKHNGED